MPSPRQLVTAAVFGIVTTLVLMVASTFRSAQSVVEILLTPGARVAVSVFGGLHGGEPILLLIVANVLFYSFVALAVVVVQSHFSRSQSNIGK